MEVETWRWGFHYRTVIVAIAVVIVIISTTSEIEIVVLIFVVEVVDIRSFIVVNGLNGNILNKYDKGELVLKVTSCSDRMRGIAYRQVLKQLSYRSNVLLDEWVDGLKVILMRTYIYISNEHIRNYQN